MNRPLRAALALLALVALAAWRTWPARLLPSLAAWRRPVALAGARGGRRRRARWAGALRAGPAGARHRSPGSACWRPCTSRSGCGTRLAAGSRATSPTTCSWPRAWRARATSTCATTTPARTGGSTRRARSPPTTARLAPMDGPGPPTARGCPCCWRWPYAVGGRAPAWSVMALLAAAAVTQGWRLARARAAGATWPWEPRASWPARRCSSTPVHVYTEVPSALALAASLLLLLGAPPRRRGRGRRRRRGLGAALAAPQDGPGRGRPRPAGHGPAAGPPAPGLPGRGRRCWPWPSSGYHQLIFGRPTPLAVYGGFLPPRDVVRRPLRALAGLLLDRPFGLLPLAPGFWCWRCRRAVLAWRRRREATRRACWACARRCWPRRWLAHVVGAASVRPAAFSCRLLRCWRGAGGLAGGRAPRGLARWWRPLWLVGLGAGRAGAGRARALPAAQPPRPAHPPVGGPRRRPLRRAACCPRWCSRRPRSGAWRPSGWWRWRCCWRSTWPPAEAFFLQHLGAERRSRRSWPPAAAPGGRAAATRSRSPG